MPRAGAAAVDRLSASTQNARMPEPVAMAAERPRQHDAPADVAKTDQRTAAATLTLASLAAVNWDFPLVGRTRMLTDAWRDQRQPTCFVQVPSLRTALERVLGRTRNADGVPIVRPWPIRPARFWTAMAPERLDGACRRAARRLRCRLDPIIDFTNSVALVVTPVWAPWLAELPFAAVIYDCIDELGVHVPRPDLAETYMRWERELIDRCDGAVVSATSLADGIRAHRPDLPVAVIRNGVDDVRFEKLAQSSPRPADLPSGRPIIGFVGALYEWIDWDLIAAAIGAMPDVDFVFVGPTRRGDNSSTRIDQHANAHFLGLKPYESVPAYLAAFDVCWLPFDASPVSQAANPVKLYEYLALGKPVVATPIADCAELAAVVHFSRDLAEIVALLRAALGEDDDAAREDRRDFARRNSWASRAREYTAFAGRILSRSRG